MVGPEEVLEQPDRINLLVLVAMVVHTVAVEVADIVVRPAPVKMEELAV